MRGDFRDLNKPSSPYFVRSTDSCGLLSEPGSVGFQAQPALWDYWIIIQKHQSVIVALMVSMLTITGLIVFTMRPVFTADSTLLIERQAPQVLNMKALTNDDEQGADQSDYYKTQYAILRSRSLAAEVIRNSGLMQNPLFTGDSASEGLLTAVIKRLKGVLEGSAAKSSENEMGVDPALIDSYLAHLTIQPQVGTRLVVVGFSTPDAQLSARIVNAHVDAYIRQGMELHAQAGEEAVQFLEGKLAELKDRVEKSEAALNSYRKSRGIVAFSLDDGGKLRSMRLEALDKALTGAETARIGLEAEVQQINKQHYDSLPEVVDSPLIHSLSEQFAQLEAEHASMANQFMPDYPPLAQLEAKIAETRRRREAEEARIAAAIESRYRAALARERDLRDAEHAETLSAMAMNDSSLQDTILVREVDTSRQLYKSVFERMREISVESEVRLSNVSVVDKAEPPRWPSAPKKLMSMFLAGVLGLLAGAGLAFLLDYTDQSLKSPDEAERFLGLPSLGVIAEFVTNGRSTDLTKITACSDTNGKVVGCTAPRRQEVVIGSNLFSLAGEAYRAVRTSVLLSRAGEPPKTIMVTSSSPQEGKTVTAVNLALAFSRLGGRILLIDADLRRPRCHEVLGRSNGPGLTEVLTSHRGAESLIHPTDAEGLYFMSAGCSPPNPAELLGSQKIHEVVRYVAGQYDHVIFDSAPVLPVTDTILLSSSVDGVLMVVGSASPKQSVSAGCTKLNRAGAKLLGFILNRVDVQRNYHYYRYTSYSNNYYSNGNSDHGSNHTESATDRSLYM